MKDSFLNRYRLPRLVRVMFWRLQRWWQRLELILARNVGLATHGDRVFFILVPLVGFLAGLVGFLVTATIGAVQLLLWGSSHDIVNAAQTAPIWVSIGAPLIGGVVVAVLMWRSRQP